MIFMDFSKMLVEEIHKDQNIDDEDHDDYWHVNTGEEKVHAKRIKGRFRRYKWWAASLYLLFLLGPYVRWEGRQAVLFDIPARKFHIFSKTIWPQDVWMLALVLIFLALTLFVVTAIAGRIFCGYFCFQTLWTDIFTLIEERLEGPPPKRIQLDKAPWSFRKIRIKAFKHLLWIVISLLTGITFAAYFADAFWMWKAYLSLSAPMVAWVSLLFFFLCTYIFAGFMREQVCFWLCPYARIQGVMYDEETILPTYDFKRGEPKSRLRRGAEAKDVGDCIDCNLCVAVCPTGIDIRHGQQEGCITCGMCIDACDSIMDKVARPRGLIRYASFDEIKGVEQPPIYKRPRVIVYIAVILAAFSGIIYGLGSLNALDLMVLHERQPLFVRLSDGSIQNRYTLKILNKTGDDLDVRIVIDGPDGLQIAGIEGVGMVPVNSLTPYTVFIRVPLDRLTAGSVPVLFRIVDDKSGEILDEYESMFIAPQKN